MQYAHEWEWGGKGMKRTWGRGDHVSGYPISKSIRYKAHGLIGASKLLLAQSGNIKAAGIAAAGLQQRRLQGKYFSFLKL